ncbi:MAG: diguanylate cyclase [Atopobiaceae bacterium]|nr:diguanylate cyclase [Atopobiaceae bacterium]
MSENNKKNTSESGISIRVIGGVATIIAILLAFFAFARAGNVADAQESFMISEKQYLECSDAIADLQLASDFLTTKARTFVVTGRKECMEAYINEIEVVNRRGKAVEVLRMDLTSEDVTFTELEQALSASNALAKTELAAMHLAADFYGIKDMPAKVADANVSAFRRQEGGKTDYETACDLVLGASYDKTKSSIQASVQASSNALLERLDKDIAEADASMQTLLFQLRVSVALLLCVIMVLVLTLFMYVLKPLGRYVKRINKGEPLDADGAYELHYLANAYNAMYEDNSKRIEQLREFAERDALTGISNKVGYDSFLATHTRNIALLLIDVDNFREYNNVYGHDTGDAVLIKLADALGHAFRSTDFPCRIEGDTFAVVMTNMSTDLRNAIVNKIERVNAMLADDSDDLPLVTLSVGAAFSTEGMSDQDIYHAADDALQAAKLSDSSNIVFYGEGNV